MDAIDITVAERGQIVIPKEARDALGLKPGARLRLSVEDGRLVIEKRVQLDLSRWVGKAVDDVPQPLGPGDVAHGATPARHRPRGQRPVAGHPGGGVVGEPDVVVGVQLLR